MVALAKGTVIGERYRLDRLLGEGSMGEVWEATNLTLERPVALKLLHAHLARHASALERFIQEARLCASIRDPGIVDVFDFGTTPPEGRPYLVMELLDGESFEDLATRRGKVPTRTALAIVREVASTLQLAHDRGVVHRDLKPANLFLHRTPKGVVIPKILDFGISKILRRGSRVTRDGMLVGTPAYMSPEQAAGAAVDARADIYALGAILYEALSGRLPYQHDEAEDMILAIVSSTSPKLAELEPELPQSVTTLVDAAMARDPDQRIPTAAELARAIGNAVAALDNELPWYSADDSLPMVAVREELDIGEPDPALRVAPSQSRIKPATRTVPPVSTNVDTGRHRLSTAVLAAVAVVVIGTGLAVLSTFSGKDVDKSPSTPAQATAVPTDTVEPSVPVDAPTASLETAPSSSASGAPPSSSPARPVTNRGTAPSGGAKPKPRPKDIHGFD